MHAWLRQTAERLNASYWFLPALLTIGAILLALATYVVDLHLGKGWVQSIGWMHETRPDGARALLSTIAGSMISVAGTVFAITIAAVVYASGNYGPRLLTNFMTDRGNQLSLGVFIATFVYCLLILRTIRQPDESVLAGAVADTGFVPQLSLLVAFALALLSVGVLVFFLHHVPDSIRIHHVVARIGARALADVARRYPDEDGGAEPERRACLSAREIRARRTGYIEVIDFASLGRLCEAERLAVFLAVRPGDFVHADMVLMHVEGVFGAEEESALRGAFAIGFSRTPGQDIEYLIDELAEIALRALSPGINDPFTAINCLHWLSAVTAALATRDLGRDADGNRYGHCGVHGLPDDFAHFVRRGFGAVRASAAGSPAAAGVFVQALEAAGAGAVSAARLALLRAEARALLAQAETALDGPALAEVRAAVQGFAGRG